MTGTVMQAYKISDDTNVMGNTLRGHGLSKWRLVRFFLVVSGLGLFLSACETTGGYQQAFAVCDAEVGACYRQCEEYEGTTDYGSCQASCEQEASACFDRAQRSYQSVNVGYSVGYISPWFGNFCAWYPDRGFVSRYRRFRGSHFRYGARGYYPGRRYRRDGRYDPRYDGYRTPPRYRDRPRRDRPRNDRPRRDRPRYDDDRRPPRGDRPGGRPPRTDRPSQDRPLRDRPVRKRPRTERPYQEGQRPPRSRPPRARPPGSANPPRSRPPRSRPPQSRPPKANPPRSRPPRARPPARSKPPAARPSRPSRPARRPQKPVKPVPRAGGGRPAPKNDKN
ncbi:MAG: hypothetical protein AAFW83_09905 [Pseudomonadota bacterium]